VDGKQLAGMVLVVFRCYDDNATQIDFAFEFGACKLSVNCRIRFRLRTRVHSTLKYPKKFEWKLLNLFTMREPSVRSIT
jgi:hypothetical protein